MVVQVFDVPDGDIPSIMVSKDDRHAKPRLSSLSPLGERAGERGLRGRVEGSVFDLAFRLCCFRFPFASLRAIRSCGIASMSFFA